MLQRKTKKTRKTGKIKDRLQDMVWSQFEPNNEFSLQIGVLKKGKPVFKTTFGKDYKYFDLASLTKAIFTVTAYQDLYLQKKINLNMKSSDFCNWLPLRSPSIKSLLSHTSGLKAHKFLYKKISNDSNFELKKILREEVKSIENIKSKIVYSDLGFLLLGQVLEASCDKPLIYIWNQLVSYHKNLEGIHFRPLNKILSSKGQKKYAPTEDCKWRNKKLQSVVFDDNTYAMNGVAPQAGLFGSLDQMLSYGKFLRSRVYDVKLDAFFKKQADGWALGYMMPSGKLSTSGSCFSKKSIGHFGYTGTSFWFDPVKDLFVVILSNRTHPNRNDSSFNKFRPIIHDLIYQEYA